MGKITDRWRKQSEVYKIFVKDKENKLDFSEKAAQAMFDFESSGTGQIEIDCFSTSNNGYAVGKKWLNVFVSMWKEDIENGLLFKSELYEDPVFANVHWWLDEIMEKERL